MRLCIQRVKQASVSVEGRVAGSIGPGLLVLLGVAREDTRETADFLADKCINLRVFEDAAGKMNLALKEAGGRILVVSQFTLYADLKKGNRPGFTDAASPDHGRELYEYFCQAIKTRTGDVATGIFGAKMEVSLVNDGPVTLLMEK